MRNNRARKRSSSGVANLKSAKNKKSSELNGIKQRTRYSIVFINCQEERKDADGRQSH